MMFCSNCGKQIPDTVKFCNHCGAQQQITESTDPLPPATENQIENNDKVTKKPKKKRNAMKITGIVFLCIQAISVADTIMKGGELTGMLTSHVSGFAKWIVFCIPAIIGVTLLLIAKKKENK